MKFIFRIIKTFLFASGILIVIGLISIIGILLASIQKSDVKLVGENENRKNSVTPTTEPIAIPVKNTYADPTIDPDPYITCNYQYIPDRQTRSSECSHSKECQINGQWYFYSSVEQCRSDQERLIQWYKNNQVNYTFPTLIPPPIISPYDTSDAINKMKELGNYHPSFPQAQLIDGSIHFDGSPSPTLGVPYGYGYSP